MLSKSKVETSDWFYQYSHYCLEGSQPFRFLENFVYTRETSNISTIQERLCVLSLLSNKGCLYYVVFFQLLLLPGGGGELGKGGSGPAHGDQALTTQLLLDKCGIHTKVLAVPVVLLLDFLLATPSYTTTS